MRTLVTAFLFTTGLAGIATGNPVDGIYGDRDGCLYLKTGDPRHEERVVLQPEGIGLIQLFCAFREITRTAEGRYDLKTWCTGAIKPTEAAYVLEQNDGGFTLFYPSGEKIADLSKCD